MRLQLHLTVSQSRWKATDKARSCSPVSPPHFCWHHNSSDCTVSCLWEFEKERKIKELFPLCNPELMCHKVWVILVSVTEDSKHLEDRESKYFSQETGAIIQVSHYMKSHPENTKSLISRGTEDLIHKTLERIIIYASQKWNTQEYIPALKTQITV